MRNLKLLANVYLAFVISLSIIIIGGIFLYKKVTSLRAEVVKIKLSRDQLMARLNTLQNLPPDLDSETAKVLANVLPSSNPALAVIYQLRQEASKEELILDDLSVRLLQSQNSGIEEVSLSLLVRGSYDKVSTFIGNVSKMAPLMNLTNLEISEKAEVMEAYVEIKAYWAPFPETLPSITEIITPLSEKEITTLVEIKDFQKPTIQDSDIKAREEEVRDDPFELVLNNEEIS